MRNGTEIEINITLIRHGATDSNKAHRYLGQTEEGLSMEGVEELQYERQRGTYPNNKIIFSSPMLRCIQTVSVIYPEQHFIVIPQWREIDFGRFEGKHYKELEVDIEYQVWLDSNGTLPFPGGESREAFIERTNSGFDKVLFYLTEHVKDHKYNISAIVHGGTIMALLSTWEQGAYFDYQVKNAKGFECRLLCQRKNHHEQIKINVLELRRLE
ncbi:MAG: histidine phosphatase family protein [Cellulosilyticum sp.]|nr:histidine phosphatase family protein [Cellulosilyticum sp.]